jgi:hypothetical protein
MRVLCNDAAGDSVHHLFEPRRARSRGLDQDNERPVD